MQNNTPDKKTDIDELINTLLREKGEVVPSKEEMTSVIEPATPKEIPAAEVPVEKAEPIPVAEPTAPEESDAVADLVGYAEPKEVVAYTAKEKKGFSLRGLFGGKRRKAEETEEEDWADEWGLKPIGHYRAEKVEAEAPRIIAPLPEELIEERKPTLITDEFPPVQAVEETITMQVVLPSGMALPKEEAVTRIIPVHNTEAPNVEPATPTPAPQPDLVEDQLPDQLSLEEMVRVEDIDPEPTEEQEEVDAQELLQRARQERIREFTLNGEEEVNEPEEEAEPEPEEEEDEIEDFTSYEDTKAVRLELQHRIRTNLFGLLATSLLELVLLVLTVLTTMIGESPITPIGYLTVQFFALALMMVLNYSVISRGLSGLFSLRANGDTPTAIAGTVALLAVLLHFANSTATLPFWAPVAGLLLVFSGVAKLLHAVTVRRNFAFVSYPGEKYSATLIEDEATCRDIGRRVLQDGEEASVAYFRRTGFLSDYLANAYDEDVGDSWSRWLAPVGLAAAILLSAGFVLAGRVTGFWNWLQLFTGLVCLSMPCVRLASQIPLSQCCLHMLSRGGFLVGWKAVRHFGNPDAMVVDIADLYPDESMLLHGIKTFAGAHIDAAILDAASLSVRAGGPLSMIFRRIIQNKEELLHEVDSLVYEQGMGLSGWVDGRRVLVGNRRLLQNHGVDVPSLDYEDRYAKNGRRLVYLSTAGELCAMFVVSYLPDEEIRAALQDLCRTKVTLLVRSCDPNVTAEDLCADFELDAYYVDVLPAAAGRQYMQMVQDGEKERTPAVMASNGHILGTVRAFSVCRSLQVKSFLAMLVQALGAALGLLLCLVWALNSTLSVFQPILWVLITTVLALLVPLFRKL